MAIAPEKRWGLLKNVAIVFSNALTTALSAVVNKDALRSEFEL